MISKIHIKGLKSIRDMTLECSGLNLIVGTNSSGKSTFLQAILLYAQNSGEAIGLNGKIISLGEFREVRNYHMPNNSIRIELWQDKNENLSWIEFVEDKEKDEYKIKNFIDDKKSVKGTIGDGENVSINLVSKFYLHYLSCHRVGPMDIYEKNIMERDNLGINGEFALAYLLKNESEPIDKEMVIKNEDTTDSLLSQVNYWLNYIVGTVLQINDLKKTNYLQVKYNNDSDSASLDALYCRPINVGAGISYLISIIITCLASKQGDILIIENPEIHLHPKAQSRLGEFLYHISNVRRQLFVETHSDHIFNSIRVGITQKRFQQEEVRVYFFALDDNHETQCNPIIFGEYGKIIGKNQYMDINDLFDQFEIDLDKMLGL